MSQTTLADSPAPTTPSPKPPLDVQLVPTWCAVCGSEDPVPYQRDMYAIGATRFDLVRCRQCGLVYVDPRPDGAGIEAMYDDPDYYTHGYNLGVETVNYFERKDELIAQYDGEVAALEAEVGGPGSFMELGSAGGFLLEAARRRGWSVRGVELSPPAARYSKEEFDLDVFEGQLADAGIEPESLDVVVADNVLEHTEDPRQVLLELRRLLRPGAHLVVVVPTYVNSPYFRLMQEVGRMVPKPLLGKQLLGLLKMDPDSDGGYPYHILEFDHATLTRLLKRAGFETVSVERSVPRPAHLFKVERPNLRERLLRFVFVALDGAMHMGLLPGARLRVVARRPV